MALWLHSSLQGRAGTSPLLMSEAYDLLLEASAICSCWPQRRWKHLGPHVHESSDLASEPMGGPNPDFYSARISSNHNLLAMPVYHMLPICCPVILFARFA